METRMKRSFPEEALENVLPFISSHTDRNSVSLVCKSWYDIERWSRRHVYIANCYAVNPAILIRRFTDVRCITIKGKHYLADCEFIPKGWGSHALPWIQALVEAYPAMEEIRLKRMVMTDVGLKLIAKKLKCLRVLVLRICEGFSTKGLASVAANCSNLRMLDLFESEVEDLGGDWISRFPDSFTLLEFLDVDKYKLPFSILERLVDRCPNLKALRVDDLPLERAVNLLLKAPQLVDLGIGLSTIDPSPEAFRELARAFAGCKGLKSLYGLWNFKSYYLPAVYPSCSGLTFLNLCDTFMCCPDLIKLLRHCPNLQRLWVGYFIEDRGLEQVAASCKELQELKVYFDDPDDRDDPHSPGINLTERGLVSVAVGCPKLHSILYYCTQMTNAALLTVAKHRPNLTCLMINILVPQLPDYLTQQPFDNGFIAILDRCKNLKRLLFDGPFTDRLLEHIGTHGKKLELLLLAHGGNSDLGLHHVLSGCSNLRKLAVRHCSYGGLALLANSDKLERMRNLVMLSCKVSYQTCKLLGVKHPRLNVEIIGKDPLRSMSDECLVDNLYVYRTVAGPRLDMPTFVRNTSKKGQLGQV